MKIEDFKKKNEEQIFVIDGGEQPPLLNIKVRRDSLDTSLLYYQRRRGKQGDFCRTEPQLYQRRRGSGGARELSTCC